MTYIYQINYNRSGWYYDIINSTTGLEVNTRAYFETYDEAKLAADAQIWQLNLATAA